MLATVPSPDTRPPEALSGSEEHLFRKLEQATEQDKNLDRKLVFQRMLGHVAMQRASTGAEDIIRGDTPDEQATPYNQRLDDISVLSEDFRESYKTKRGIAARDGVLLRPQSRSEKRAAKKLHGKLAKHDSKINKEHKEHLRSGLTPQRIRIRATRINIRHAQKDVEDQYKRGEITAQEREKLRAKAVVDGTEKKVNSTHLRRKQAAVDRSARSLQRYAARRGVEFELPERTGKNSEGHDMVYRNKQDSVLATDHLQNGFNAAREGLSDVSRGVGEKDNKIARKRARIVRKRKRVISKLQKIAENDNAAALAREAEEDEA